MIRQVTKLSFISTNIFLIKTFQIESFERRRTRKKIKSYAHEQYNDLKILFLNDVVDDVQNKKSIENEQISVESAHRLNEETFKS